MDWDGSAKLLMCLAGDLHFYMRHSFRPAPAPMKANGKVANGHADDFSGNNPFAESAPSRLAAAKTLGARNASVSGSSVASSEADEAELGRDIYQDLASLVHNGKIALSPSIPLPALYQFRSQSKSRAFLKSLCERAWPACSGGLLPRRVHQLSNEF